MENNIMLDDIANDNLREESSKRSRKPSSSRHDCRKRARNNAFLPLRIRGHILDKKSSDLFDRTKDDEEIPKDIEWVRAVGPQGRFDEAPRSFCHRYWWERAAGPESMSCRTETIYPEDSVCDLWDANELIRIGMGDKASEVCEREGLTLSKPLKKKLVWSDGSIVNVKLHQAISSSVKMRQVEIKPIYCLRRSCDND